MKTKNFCTKILNSDEIDQLLSHGYGLPSTIDDLVQSYNRLEEILSDSCLETSLSDAIIDHQSNILEKIVNTESTSIHDVYLKLDLWMRENPDVKGNTVSNVDALALSAASDIEKYTSVK